MEIEKDTPEKLMVKKKLYIEEKLDDEIPHPASKQNNKKKKMAPTKKKISHNENLVIEHKEIDNEMEFPKVL